MTSDAQEMLDLFLVRIGQAQDMATTIAGVATALRNLLTALDTWRYRDALSQHAVLAEQEARKALEVWDRFWSIEAVPVIEQQKGE